MSWESCLTEILLFFVKIKRIHFRSEGKCGTLAFTFGQHYLIWEISSPAPLVPWPCRSARCSFFLGIILALTWIPNVWVLPSDFTSWLLMKHPEELNSFNFTFTVVDRCQVAMSLYLFSSSLVYNQWKVAWLDVNIPMAESASSNCQIHWIPSWPRIPCLNKETLLVITVDAEVQGGNMLVTGLHDSV